MEDENAKRANSGLPQTRGADGAPEVVNEVVIEMESAEFAAS
jgi:hypothetical protein